MGGRERFRSARLRVHELAASDLTDLLAVYGDAEAMRYVDDGRPLTQADAVRWTEVTHRNERERGYGMWTVRLAETGRTVGFCGLVHPNGARDPELKYALHRQYWGQGYGREVAAGALAYGLGPLCLPRVEATVAAAHLASRRIVASIGMRIVARERERDGSVTLRYCAEAKQH